MQRPPWLGKLIGGGLGLLAAGPFGAIVGLLIGHIVDSVQRVKRFVGGKLQAVQSTFFETTFTLMGHIAKSDGRISEREIAVTEQLMARMGLGAAHRQEAIALFKRGAQPEFDTEAQLTRFMTQCGAHPSLRQMLLMFLFSTAAADGAIVVRGRVSKQRPGIEEAGRRLGDRIRPDGQHEGERHPGHTSP